MSATFCRVVNGGALVTACRAVTAVSLSANNVGFGAGVTLSWSGAAGGAGNPIRGYEVYRDGVLLTTVFDGTSCTVTSPTSNGSYKYTVKALGSIAGFDAPVSTASATLTSKVSAPTAPTSVWLSATDVRIGKSVTLSWSGAAGGTNNPVAKYHVYRGGAYLTETTGTSCAVTASGTAGGKYTYTVYAIGSVSGWNSGASAGVTLTAHGAESAISYFASSTTWTVPSWAERVDVSCIGAGGGGSGGGYSQYGESTSAGAGGGSGYINHYGSVSIAAGSTISINVGGGGAAGSDLHGNGGTGGTSSVSSAQAGGGAGGYWVSTDKPVRQHGAVGGNGGHGGGGGGCMADTGGAGGWGAGGTRGFPCYWLDGGGPETGNGAIYACVGGGGAYDGANNGLGVGDGKARGRTAAYQNNGGRTTNTGNMYVFADANTQRYLGNGGNGGSGNGRYGGDGGYCSGMSGTAYGKGGNGGSFWAETGNAGQSGLVAIRVWRYLS